MKSAGATPSKQMPNKLTSILYLSFQKDFTFLVFVGLLSNHFIVGKAELVRIKMTFW